MMSAPYGLPPTWSSIHATSWSSCCGVNAVAPSTPKPPALVTAATTSRQWLNAKSGKSMPNCSQIAGFTPPVLLVGVRLRQKLSDLVEHLAAADQLRVVVSGAGHDEVSLGFGGRIVEPPAERLRHD